MSKNLIKRTQNTLTATAYLPYGAYKALVQLAQDHNAEIGKTSQGFLTVTFDSVETADNVAKKFRADYAEAHAVYVSAHASEPAPTPKQEAKPQKPQGKGKANLTGEAWVKANPSCTREEAAAHGLKGITKLELKALKVKLGVR